MVQKTLVIDLDRCIGCYACEVACKLENGVALGVFYNKVLTVGPSGTFPDLEQYFLPTVCQGCTDPPCVKVCPTGASYKTDDGHVLIDKETCIGCRYCMMACPYGARSYNEETHTVEKCTLCNHLEAVGEQPACVKACCGNARFFGDIDDPDSNVARVLKEAGSDSVHALPDVGNHPSVRYILHRQTALWRENQPVDTWRNRQNG
ncbi:4Fe-4S dicluster domain-containing protein [Brenneria tiliae]|uniref:4Fe-4S dicluster domain-containing protein n=1 Tax=Brenneria tiliae TaxID=2914984 RepID=A0ABT0MTH2_9GAMM|nr:4Fe-4S dicluster domain-containing protein [Brenneria tiliae]MCL2892867.1 4Fe-4S dicluster domain-containing protein [Brenneria tiliae]